MSTSTSVIELSSPIADAVRAAQASTVGAVVAKADATSMADRLEHARHEARSLASTLASGRRAG